MGRVGKRALKDAAQPAIDWQPTLLVLARHRAELSQEQATQRCTAIGAPMTRAALSKWEQGRTQPDGRQIAALAQVYDCEVDDFYAAEPYEPPPVEPDAKG